MQPRPDQTPKIALLLMAAALFFALVTASRPANAGNNSTAQTTPTVEIDTAGTPALLMTPFPTLAAAETTRPMNALLATAALLMCGMVGMLVSGIGFAVLMVRWRTGRR